MRGDVETYILYKSTKSFYSIKYLPLFMDLHRARSLNSFVLEWWRGDEKQNNINIINTSWMGKVILPFTGFEK